MSAVIEQALPNGFEALLPFVTQWAAPTAPERMQRRLHSSADERAAFYAAANDLLCAGLERLDGKPLAAFDAQEQRLMQMLLSLCHVALAVEMQGDDEDMQARSRRHMRITRAVADE